MELDVQLESGSRSVMSESCLGSCELSPDARLPCFHALLFTRAVTTHQTPLNLASTAEDTPGEHGGESTAARLC
jgi:hypothetical protein